MSDPKEVLSDPGFEDFDGLEALGQLTHSGDPRFQCTLSETINPAHTKLAASGNKAYREERMARLRAELEAMYGVIK